MDDSSPTPQTSAPATSDIWVRSREKGAASLLTTSNADESEPAFSPDGGWLVYRSEENGGGIYIVPVGGGAPKLLAPSGRTPRFSPDGKWIAYWIGNLSEGHLRGANSSRMYVMASTGGPPQQLQAQFLAARYPTWSPDGKFLLFAGVEAAERPSADWYVYDIARRSTAPIRAAQAFTKARLTSPSARSHIYPSAWLPSGVLFAAHSGDSTNLWWLPLDSAPPWRAGEAARLTSGTDTQVHPVAGRQETDGTVPLIFTTLHENVDVWSIRVPHLGQPPDGAVRLTQDQSSDIAGEISRDGRFLAFVSDRTGTNELWIRDLPSGAERKLTGPPHGKSHFHFSGDGKSIGFATNEASQPLYEIPVAGGSPRKICEHCGFIWDWTADKNKIIHVVGLPARFRLLDRVTGNRLDALYHAAFQLYLPQWSPDGNWVTFIARTGADRSHICVARLQQNERSDETDWIPVTSGDTWDDKPTWSHDGNAIFFTSDRDGFRCLWMQPLDSASKRPKGYARAIFHSHQARISIGNVPINSLDVSVQHNTIVFGQSQRDGTIWLSSLRVKP